MSQPMSDDEKRGWKIFGAMALVAIFASTLTFVFLLWLWRPLEKKDISGEEVIKRAITRVIEAEERKVFEERVEWRSKYAVTKFYKDLTDNDPAEEELTEVSGSKNRKESVVEKRPAEELLEKKQQVSDEKLEEITQLRERLEKQEVLSGSISKQLGEIKRQQESLSESVSAQQKALLESISKQQEAFLETIGKKLKDKEDLDIREEFKKQIALLMDTLKQQQEALLTNIEQKEISNIKEQLKKQEDLLGCIAKQLEDISKFFKMEIIEGPVLKPSPEAVLIPPRPDVLPPVKQKK